MRFVVLFVILLGSTTPVLAQLDVRYQVAGSDNNVWAAGINLSNNTVVVLRNGSDIFVPQAGGQTLSSPALTRLGSTIYMLRRGLDDVVYCNRLPWPYTSWIGWVSLGGTTSSALAVASSLSRVYVAGREKTSDGLYTRDVTDCGGTWSWTGFYTNDAPEMISDDAGVRIYFYDLNGDSRSLVLGATVAPRVAVFGSDKELHGARLFVAPYWVGHGPIAHSILLFGNAATPLGAPGTCNLTPLTGMARGNSSSSICYASDVSAGDVLVNTRFSPTSPSNSGQYSWRSCIVGFSSSDLDAPCDISLLSHDVFPDLLQTSAANLRAKVQIHNASHTASGLSQVSLGIRLVSEIVGSGSNEVEMQMLVHWNNTQSCYTLVDHDNHGRHTFFFTPTCMGLPNVTSGQTTFYTVDLRSYILSKINDHFQASNGRHDDLPTYDPQYWKITWGVSVITGRGGQDQVAATVDDVHLEVLY